MGAIPSKADKLCVSEGGKAAQRRSRDKPSSIIVQLEKRDGEEFHVFRYGEHFYSDVRVRRQTGIRKIPTPLRHLYKKQLLAFFRFGDMCRYEWILNSANTSRQVDKTQ